MQDKFKIGDVVSQLLHGSEMIGTVIGFPTKQVSNHYSNMVYVEFTETHSNGYVAQHVDMIDIRFLDHANDVKVEPKTSEYCEVYVEGDPTYPISSFSSMKDGLAFARNEKRAYKIICNIGTQTLIFGRIDGVSIRGNEWFLLETLDKIEDMDWLASLKRKV